METNHPSNSSGTRRSYPNLHHISLAPLTPRFPIDDDPEAPDYFSPRDDSSNNVARTSYLTSVSVPSTPPILSHSRSSSRTRHSRSKSSTRATPASDTNLQSNNITLPLHHQPHAHSHEKRSSSSHIRRQTGETTSKTDAEWMLRAGIALASSTREQKGQSWLSKRESSTSLVSEMPESPTHTRGHTRNKSAASSRMSRSGASTPAAWSRRSSRSHVGSRRGSRAGLAMTSMPLSSVSSVAVNKVPSPGTGTISPEMRGRGVLVPDFVDERIRAEIAQIQQESVLFDGDEEVWDEEDDDSEYDYFSDETPDDIDEADLQRLTRERGFGLGSWIDRVVEWTLFGVDELPEAISSTASATTRIGAAPTTTVVTFEEPSFSRSEDGEQQQEDNLSHVSGGDEVETLSYTDGEVVNVEKPGPQGGWEDASWLFRVVKRALV